MNKLIDLTGQRFGRLIVLERAENKNKDRHACWLCQCDCGNQVVVYGVSLRNKDTQSCGCLQKERTKISNRDKQPKIQKELIGKVFGYLTVIDYSSFKEGKTWWKCQCSCGNVIEVRQDYLKSGHSQSCGCLKSKGEKKISEILTQNNISFEKEYSFPDLKDKIPLRFDFAILDNSKIICLIEYNGIQHYIAGQGWNTEEHFQILKNHDALKAKYCNENNIKLIVIPYTDYDKLTFEYLRDLIY